MYEGSQATCVRHVKSDLKTKRGRQEENFTSQNTLLHIVFLHIAHVDSSFPYLSFPFVILDSAYVIICCRSWRQSARNLWKTLLQTREK